MNSNLTEIAVIVDRSGSMHSIWSDTLGGLRAFVEDQKKVPGDANLTLAVFDDEYQTPYRRSNLKYVDLSHPDFSPRGTTALYDAVGRTVTDLGLQLSRMSEADRPGNVLVAVFTDGLENASREFTGPQIAALIREQEEKYSWTFLFLAAGMDAMLEAERLGIRKNRSVMYEATGENQVSAYDALSEVTTCYRMQASGEIDLKAVYKKHSGKGKGGK